MRRSLLTRLGAYPAVIAASPNGQWLSLFYPRFLTQETMPRQTGHGLLSLESRQVTPISHGAGMTITPDGVTFVPLSLTGGLLVTLP